MRQDQAILNQIPDELTERYIVSDIFLMLLGSSSNLFLYN